MKELAPLLELVSDGVYHIDQDRVIRTWNRAAELISGFPADEVVGNRCRDNILVHVDGEGCKLCIGGCPLADSLGDGQPREGEVFMHHRDGHRVPVRVQVRAIRGDGGEITGAVQVFSDLSREAYLEARVAELEHLAMMDRLTGLPNRNHMEPELDVRFSEMERMGIHFGVVMLDIDHFKRFNDQYGHVLGDRVLRAVASTLRASTRPFDLFGRWGGEEFIGIIRDVNQVPQLKMVAERIRALVSETFVMHREPPLGVTVSVGATLARPGDTAAIVVARAGPPALPQQAVRTRQRGRGRHRSVGYALNHSS